MIRLVLVSQLNVTIATQPPHRFGVGMTKAELCAIRRRLTYFNS